MEGWGPILGEDPAQFLVRISNIFLGWSSSAEQETITLIMRTPSAS